MLTNEGQLTPIATPCAFRVGEWFVDPALDEVSRNGKVIRLEPRTMKLLVRLAQSPGQVISSQQLLNTVWSGVIVGPASVYQGISQLRKVLGDTDPVPTYVATIPRKGYRLIAPVQRVDGSASCEAPPTSIATAPDSSPVHRRVARLGWGIGALPLVIVAGIATLIAVRDPERSQMSPSSASEPLSQTIAVLPFADLSPSKDMEYFGDGIADELMSGLAKVERLRVVGRTSSFAFKGKDQDVRSIGNMLGVEHILEGSVRRDGDRIRIAAKLIRARDGYALWSETYDRRLHEVLDVQGAIGREVVGTLAPMVLRDSSTDAATISAISTRSPDAYAAYLRGIHFSRLTTQADMTRARDEFLRAVTLDPSFASAHAHLGASYAQMSTWAIGDTRQLTLAAQDSLDRALQLDPELAELWWIKSRFLQHPDAPLSHRAHELEQVLLANPSEAKAMLWLFGVYTQQGRGAESLQMLERAYRADPLSPFIIIRLAETAYNITGDRKRMLTLLDEMESLSPTDPWPSQTRASLAFAEGRALDWDFWAARAVTMAPTDLGVQGYLSLDYANLGMFDAALHHARACQKVSPNASAGWYNVAHALLAARDLVAAREVVNEVIARHPNDSLALVALAKMQYFEEDCENSIDSLIRGRPALGRPAASLILIAQSTAVPMLAWCHRKLGHTTRVEELKRAFDIQIAPLWRFGPEASDGLRVRMAAAIGDRSALISHLSTLANSQSMSFAFSRHEPMIQPYLPDAKIIALLDRLDARRAKWRKLLPKTSLRVPVPNPISAADNTVPSTSGHSPLPNQAARQRYR